MGPKVDSGDHRKDRIHRAAIQEFSARGFSATSMANIAEAAEMSRPALYQYFRNKGDIFASAFTALLNDAADRALGALETPGSTADQLDGFLQSFDGDLWEHMAASPHSDEILSAKSAHANDMAGEVFDRLWTEFATHLAQIGAGGTGAQAAKQRTAWVDMLRLSPKGFKFDQPSVDVYRSRLTTLAGAVAADIDAS